ncbi:restriction endonuclease subunit S [Pantoea trifolii]|uniref:Restriction endonuclease subunit S n=1 Tax=Pantoea trifolii TaxID=2968030 RepID=A0ABT1VH81_9GAMM|nr:MULTISPECIES: restriction endonuclease subunit S [unclassified Pantoea]MCQ8226889.1 restriction endonuclease subunit S [Pantoea sp. MMK2]MCQ8235061.1 restriction endonuclease subunit S [Pantoea sp. MMK3]
MSKYKAYPEYMDSGIEWLGSIPDHWKTFSGKRMFKSVRIPAEKGDEQLAASQRYGVIPQSLMMQLNDSKVMLALKGTDSFRHVAENDFVISLRSFEGGIEHSQYTGCVSPAYTVLKNSKPISYGYYRYLFKCMPFIAALQSSTDSLRDGKSINYEQFSAIDLPLTSLCEQNTIAAFLDFETAKIDKLIEKQKQLIELLKEKRMAVISHAVTKGLNPDVPMKDSGVDWLGQVPEHWIVRRLKHTASLQSGIPKGKDLTGKKSISVPMLRVANVQDGYLDLEDVHNIDIEPSQLGRYLLRNGDVLMNEGGDNDQLGRGAVWMAPINNCIHQNHVFSIRPKNIESEWLDMLTRAAYAKFYFYRVAKQSTNLASISSTNIKETPLLIPPVEERKEILKFIKLQLERLKATEELSIDQITLLRERRTALISAAVTGKIDVRDWVAPDTQEVEELQETTA